ncbi:hypothetical protein AG1IA_10297 [Rhizoctonia solani AG-1 IA]|uniref:Uncharacterized protein n=1 Tax=Thanatephorus cucumeris (strain AG1-IA) TaxID=983506 RepID=L8WFW1_THACA|nr:hypothetical protein AG1IA_10297 [Rhizoctonia solani AG-1 IA]
MPAIAYGHTLARTLYLRIDVRPYETSRASCEEGGRIVEGWADCHGPAGMQEVMVGPGVLSAVCKRYGI